MWISGAGDRTAGPLMEGRPCSQMMKRTQAPCSKPTPPVCCFQGFFSQYKVHNSKRKDSKQKINSVFEGLRVRGRTASSLLSNGLLSLSNLDWNIRRHNGRKGPHISGVSRLSSVGRKEINRRNRRLCLAATCTVPRSGGLASGLTLSSTQRTHMDSNCLQLDGQDGIRVLIKVADHAISLCLVNRD